MRTIYRAALAAIAVGATAACHNNNSRAADSANGTLSSGGPPTGTAFSDTSNRANTSPSAVPAESASAAGTVVPGTPSASSSTGAMSDANMLAQSEAGDSAEVAISNYMAANTSNSSVRAFAILLRNDHSRDMSRIKSMQVPLQLQPTDTTAQATSHVLDHLKSLNGADRDSAYVNHEIEDHQDEINEIQQRVQSAQNPQVKSVEQSELAALKKHLDRAQQLASQMGTK